MFLTPVSSLIEIESQRKLSLVISLTISDLRGSSRGASANWRASLSSRRKERLNSQDSRKASSLAVAGSPKLFVTFFGFRLGRYLPVKVPRRLPAHGITLFCVAVYCRVNLAKCLFTIFKTSIYLLTSFRVNWIKRNWFSVRCVVPVLSCV